MPKVKPDMIDDAAADTAMWDDDTTLLPRAFFYNLDLASAGHALFHPEILNMSDSVRPFAPSLDASARMGLRLTGAHCAEFLREQAGIPAVRQFLRRHPDATIALVRTRGPVDARDIGFEILGPSGEVAMNLSLRRSLAATRDGGDLRVAYRLDASFGVGEAPAVDRHMAVAIAGKLVTVQAGLDILELVGSLNERGTPARVSFSVRGTEVLPPVVEGAVEDTVAAFRSDFHDWFGPFDGSEPCCEADVATTDGLWLADDRRTSPAMA